MKTEILKYERIRDMRIDRGLTQKEVAKVINVKQNTYSQYEIGVLNYPLDVVIKLAEFYETSVDYLVGLTDVPVHMNEGNQNKASIFYDTRFLFALFCYYFWLLCNSLNQKY
mgnify:CR=1 FL=1